MARAERIELDPSQLKKITDALNGVAKALNEWRRANEQAFRALTEVLNNLPPVELARLKDEAAGDEEISES